MRREDVRECPIHGVATHSLEVEPGAPGEPPRELSAVCVICQREEAQRKRDAAPLDPADSADWA